MTSRRDACCRTALLVFAGLIIGGALLGCAARIDKRIAQADALRGTQHYAEALQMYDGIVRDFPGDARLPDILLRIGDLYSFNLKQSEPARMYYERIVARWPRSSVAVTVYLRLADLADNAGDRPGVIEPLEYLLRYFPVYPERHAVRRRIALQYLQMKSYEQARIELQSLLDAPDCPDDVRAQLFLDMADTYLLPKHAARAVVWLQRAVDAAPNDELADRARALLADVQLEMGDHRMALSLLEDDVADGDAPVADSTAAEPVLPMQFPRGNIIVTPTGGRAFTVNVEVAATETERERGLMYRKKLAPNTGMWFVFAQPERSAFWMKNTAVSLDLLFVDAAGRVVDIIANTTPFSEMPLLPQLPYQYVLEVPAGFAARHALHVGATARFER